MRIYVASSWANKSYPKVVEALRVAGHDVYDFRTNGFHWNDILDTNLDMLGQVSPAALDKALANPKALHHFDDDFEALDTCDACVLVLPSGRSSHLELGHAAGRNKTTVILYDGPDSVVVPELMYLMVDWRVDSIGELVSILDSPEAQYCAVKNMRAE